MLQSDIPFAKFTKGRFPTTTKIFRAIALGLFVASFASVFASSFSIAQTPAPAATAPAAPAATPPAPPPPPACGGSVLEKCTVNSGDTAWMLTSVALVLMMTDPRPRPLLRRHGAQEECRRHRDDELRHHLPCHRVVGRRQLQSRVHAPARRSSADSIGPSCRAS